MANKKLTPIEKNTVLEILAAAENIFEKDNDIGAWIDGGNFVCSLPSKNHVNAIKSAYRKILLM